MFATPAAPGTRLNGTPRNNMNKAQSKLSLALNNIAYHHVQKYANAIKANAKAKAAAVNAANVAAARPSAANANKAAAALATAAEAANKEKEAEQAAGAAANVAARAANVGTQAPNTPAAVAALTAETQAVNSTKVLMNRINASTNANNMNNILKSNNFLALRSNNQTRVRNYSRAKFPRTGSIYVTGARGSDVSLVKNSPSASSWRFRKVNAQKGYILTNANTNSPKVYFSAAFLPKNG